jgi:hypothetical protein
MRGLMILCCLALYQLATTSAYYKDMAGLGKLHSSLNRMTFVIFSDNGMLIVVLTLRVCSPVLYFESLQPYLYDSSTRGYHPHLHWP